MADGSRLLDVLGKSEGDVRSGRGSRQKGIRSGKRARPIFFAEKEVPGVHERHEVCRCSGGAAGPRRNPCHHCTGMARKANVEEGVVEGGSKKQRARSL